MFLHLSIPILLCSAFILLYSILNTSTTTTAPMSQKALLLHEPGKPLTLGDRAIPQPGENQLLVKVLVAGRKNPPHPNLPNQLTNNTSKPPRPTNPRPRPLRPLIPLHPRQRPRRLRPNRRPRLSRRNFQARRADLRAHHGRARLGQRLQRRAAVRARGCEVRRKSRREQPERR